jgi:hypothetical protein
MQNRIVQVKFDVARRFGIEFEFDGPIDHAVDSPISLPLRKRCRDTINEIPGQSASVVDYDHHRNNDEWLCKPDGSCGIEVISPVMSGHEDLRAAGEVLAAMRDAAGMAISNKCGMHVHVDVGDLVNKDGTWSAMNSNVIKTIAAWWIKFEHLALGAVPAHRRNNRYCMSYEDYLRASDIVLEPYVNPDLDTIFELMTRDRHFTLNLSLWRDAAPRIEFRFGHMTWEVEEMKNRVRFLLWFVKIAAAMPPPPNLNWMSPKQAVRFLGLCEAKNKVLSPAMASMRRWLMDNLAAYSDNPRDKEMAEEEVRKRAEGAAERIDVPF